MINRYFFLVIGLVIIAAMFSCKNVKDNHNQDDQNDEFQFGVYVNNIAVNFTEIDKNGNNFNLDSFKGKVILLVFSAMWCSPCREEVTHLMELYNTYKERGFEVVQCVFEDEDSNPADQSDLKRWIQEFDLTFTVVNDLDYSTVYLYNFDSIPFNIIIDREFIIRYRVSGFNPQSIKNIIEDYL